jgi:EAL domain-containing protein (putative c-di-GMP-specific phosphodiesterase class I)
LIRTVSQPIVNLVTGDKVLEERLCRPNCPIREYFSIKDKNTLMRRELHSILQCIEESNDTPYNVNVTAYTLPFLTRIPISWNGGIEIVEWEFSASPYFKQMRQAISELQARGLMVWADDVTANALEMWLKAGVNGLKVEMEKIKQDESFVEQLKLSKKPVIIERVETTAEDRLIREHGFTLAQGFYYGAPEGIELKRVVTG